MLNEFLGDTCVEHNKGLLLFFGFKSVDVTLQKFQLLRIGPAFSTHVAQWWEETSRWGDGEQPVRRGERVDRERGTSRRRERNESTEREERVARERNEGNTMGGKKTKGESNGEEWRPRANGDLHLPQCDLLLSPM